MQKKIDKIIVRVYALIIHKDRILVSDEFWYDTPMTKFPGGGLEPGEGIKDCLIRELNEELGVIPSKAEHFYTCEQMIASEFIPFTQVIPVYYRVELKDYSLLKVSEYRYDFKQLENGAISLRWIDLSLLDESELTFSGDKEALKVYRKTFALSGLKNQ
jgi:8-oxo-dGTP diphosphatase